MESSLHIAIKHHCPAESIDMMLMAMPSAAATKDRHSNTPLHAACLFRPHDKDDLIRNLLLHQPAAANEENFHGHTPLRLLERSNQHVSETTLNLMQRGHCFERSLFSETPSRRMTGATAFI
jgi:ankyrin repeat protein